MYSTDRIHLSPSIPTLLCLCIPLSKTLTIDRPAFPQKHDNKHLLSGPFQPPRTHRRASTLFQAEGAFSTTSTLVADSSLPQGQAPTPVPRTRTSTRSVGGTRTSRVDNGLRSPTLYKCSCRMHDASSVAEAPLYRPRVALKTMYVFICFPTHLFSREWWLMGVTQAPCSPVSPLTQHSCSPLHYSGAPWPAVPTSTAYPAATDS